MTGDERRRSVFVNCPFDRSYRPLFDAVIFTLFYCGFKVRSALEASDSGDLRLTKIIRLIEQCPLSVHDISRVQLDEDSGLPRFNMPIELGLALGMKYFGRAKLRDHQLLVLDTDRYRYQRFASDLAGVDIAPHGDQVSGVIIAVRDFLVPHVSEHLPGRAAIAAAYEAYGEWLPNAAVAAGQNHEELTFSDRLRHLALFLESVR